MSSKDCSRCGHHWCYHEGTEQWMGDRHLRGYCRGLFVRERHKQPFQTGYGCGCPGFVKP